MSYGWHCPNEYEARQRARNDASRDVEDGYRSYSSPFSDCPDASQHYEREYGREYSYLEQQREEEQAAQRRAEYRREEERQEEERQEEERQEEERQEEEYYMRGYAEEEQRRAEEAEQYQQMAEQEQAEGTPK